MLWHQNYSLEFCKRWWIIGSINPSNKLFLQTKQTNSLTWMILQLGCVQWKSLWPYSVVWLEKASFIDQTKMKSANWYFWKINWSNLQFSIKQKRVFELDQLLVKFYGRTFIWRKGNYKIWRGTPKKKTQTKQNKKQNKLNKQQKQTKKMQLYETICKQTMRL